MTDATVELVWDIRCDTGESPVFDARNRRILFCDIPAGVIHAYSTVDGATRTWNVGDLVASFGICRSGRWVVALRDSVVVFDPATGYLKKRDLGHSSARLPFGKLG